MERKDGQANEDRYNHVISMGGSGIIATKNKVISRARSRSTFYHFKSIDQKPLPNIVS